MHFLILQTKAPILPGQSLGPMYMLTYRNVSKQKEKEFFHKNISRNEMNMDGVDIYVNTAKQVSILK